MKVRATLAGTVLSGRLTAVACGVSVILACVVLSACSGGSSTTTPAIFTPSVTGSASVTAVPSSRPASVPPTTTASPSAGSTTSPTATATAKTPPTATATATAKTPTASASPTPSRSASAFPTAAPSTGGGGTAGVQDVLLFALGGGAIVAGAGSIAYRRKLTRDR